MSSHTLPPRETTVCTEKAGDGTTGSRITVWDVPTRVFHWLLAASFAGAYLTAESERYRDVHLLFGYTLAALIGFRLVWGLVGSPYARFSSFLFAPPQVWEYLKSLLTPAPKHYVGHNPAGALAIFALLALGLLTAGSGFATYQEVGGEWMAELHEGAASTLLAVVALHLLGVAVSSWLHRENLIGAMISGRKRGSADQGITQSRPVIGILLLLAVLALWSADRAGGVPPPTGSTSQNHSHHHD